MLREADQIDASGVLHPLLAERLRTVDPCPPPPTWRPAEAFARDADWLTIWIDEAWPEDATDEDDRLTEGVIAGVVFIGGADADVLALPKQHLREDPENFPSRAREHLTELSRCERALPFVFRFRSGEGRDARRDYWRLVLETVRLLLGWYLPSDGPRCDVDVTCEAIGADFPHGHDATGKILDLLDVQDAATRPRFQRWNLRSVTWQKKDLRSPQHFTESDIIDQGYLGFGDLLAYVATFPKAKPVRDWLDLRALPVHLTLEFDEFSLLTALDRLQSSASAQDLLAAEARFGMTTLWPRLEPVLRTALAASPRLRSATVEVLADGLRAADRDLYRIAATLRRMTRLRDGRMPEDDVRTRALWRVAELQLANHRGDPAEAARVATNLAALRDELEDLDQDLLAFIDLNLAVADADRFCFWTEPPAPARWTRPPCTGRSTPSNGDRKRRSPAWSASSRPWASPRSSRPWTPARVTCSHTPTVTTCWCGRSGSDARTPSRVATSRAPAPGSAANSTLGRSSDSTEGSCCWTWAVTRRRRDAGTRPSPSRARAARP